MTRLRTLLTRESEATGLPLGWILAGAVTVHAAMSVLAVNPWHPDEHFQILEFAWARSGLSPLDALPWEWGAQIRSALQPTAALVALRSLRAVGVESPFAWALLLRLLTLALTLTVLARALLHVAPGMTRSGRRVLWLAGSLLWFTPLFYFRFTSENLAGLALVGAMPFLTPEPGARPRPAGDVAAGLLLGLSFVFRFQMAFAVIGLLAWAWRFRSGGRVVAVRIVLAFAGVVAASVLVDSWFYGEWVFTPWNYFRVNLVEGVASSFGTEPPWWYAAWVPVWMAPPLGPVVAVLVAAGVLGRLRSPWSWAFVAFFVGHSAIPHKEVRFLLPVLPFVPVLAARGVERVTAHWRDEPPAWFRGLSWVLVAQNAALLALLLTPAIHRGREVDMHYVRWLWDRAEAFPEDTVYVLQDDGDPYLIYQNPTNVYRHPRVQGVTFRGGGPLPARVPAGTPPERLLLLTRAGAGPRMAGGRVGDTVYAAEPGYRTLARRLGVEDATWLRRLEGVDGWTQPSLARQVLEVHQGDRRTRIRPEGDDGRP